MMCYTEINHIQLSLNILPNRVKLYRNDLGTYNATDYSLLETSIHLEITDYFQFVSNVKFNQ